ncbi:hypothetical protein SFA32_12180 [Buttiauxella sp. HR94]|nr:hypothetical protein SFA32_12180 [Buttiauxella sp. HR94]
MITADYQIRKYLINKLSKVVNLQYPSKASLDDTKMVYIGDSTVTRNQISTVNHVHNGQVIPPTVRNLCDFRVEFVAVGQSLKNASEEIEKILDVIFSVDFFTDLNSTLALAIFNIRIEDSMMTNQAEASDTPYVHTQSLSFSYGE